MSAEEEYSAFGSNDLFWLERRLYYGDWTAGPDADGVLSKSSSVLLPEVRIVIFNRKIIM